MRWPTRSSVVAFAAPALGFALGLAVTLTDPDRHAPLWSVWMPLAVALTTAAGSVFAYGLRRWADLRRWHEVRVRDAAMPVAGLVIVAAFLDQELPLGKLTDLQAILSTAGQRQKLEQVLGTDRNVFADLQTGLAILAPLLASAAVAFLPR